MEYRYFKTNADKRWFHGSGSTTQLERVRSDTFHSIHEQDLFINSHVSLTIDVWELQTFIGRTVKNTTNHTGHGKIHLIKTGMWSPNYKKQIVKLKRKQR